MAPPVVGVFPSHPACRVSRHAASRHPDPGQGAFQSNPMQLRRPNPTPRRKSCSRRRKRPRRAKPTRRAERAAMSLRRTPIHENGHGRGWRIFRATQVRRRKPSGRAKRRKPAPNGGGRLAARGTAGSRDPRRTESGRVGRPGGGGRRRDFRERSRRDARSLREDDPPARVHCDTPPGLKSCGFWTNSSSEEFSVQGPIRAYHGDRSP